MNTYTIEFGDVVILPSGSRYRADDFNGYTNWVRVNNEPDEGADDTTCPEKTDETLQQLIDSLDKTLERNKLYGVSYES